jgi:sugar O-acyltransferase (sialic acid O-acetyltransferase NeuD family)
MTQAIAIYGAGGFAREVLQIVLDINAASATPVWEPLGFVVDSAFVGGGTAVHGLPILGGPDWLAQNPTTHLVIAIGAPAAKHRIAMEVGAASGNPFALLVHPRAWVGCNVHIGQGAIVCAGCLVTTDIRIGGHVHVNIGCTLGHDAELKDFATLNPSVNVSGNVNIGVGSEIGTGSILIPHAHVGDWSIVGAGALVTKPLPGNVTAVGSPARVIKTRPTNWHLGL